MKPNLLAGRSNLARIIEIAMCGNLSINLFMADVEVPFEDYKSFLNEFAPHVNFVNTLDNCLIVEFQKIDNLRAFQKFSHEDTIETVLERVTKANKQSVVIDNQLDESSIQLLKVATQRLNLSIGTVEFIIETAKVIAKMDGAKSIGVAHIAEAIQYQSSRLEVTEVTEMFFVKYGSENTRQFDNYYEADNLYNESLREGTRVESFTRVITITQNIK